MVRTGATEDVVHDLPDGSTDRGLGHGKVLHNNPLPPPLRVPVSIEDLLATHNELMRVFMRNEENFGEGRSQHH
jgi:hypothetical protein